MCSSTFAMSSKTLSWSSSKGQPRFWYLCCRFASRDLSRLLKIHHLSALPRNLKHSCDHQMAMHVKFECLVQDTNSDLQANVAGALQSICYQKSGRAAVRGTEAAAQLCGLLSSTNPRLVMRAAGALHNVSSDADAIRSIRRYVLWAPALFTQVIAWHCTRQSPSVSMQFHRIMCRTHLYLPSLPLTQAKITN